MEKIESRTPEKSKCKHPGPPPHQPTFTSAPYCSRQCSCERRKKCNEIHEEIMNRLMKREQFTKKELKDSGIFSPDDESDKENRPQRNFAKCTADA
ncbi:unnamed protein product [Cercopithifilaria johnstoni]|uniref:Uncharacterized protein n=1 Tax=Cercopithifilaria johnstoni TaxID=2874296 RepID=A0A8J2Q9A1_9BILA|nr:unnamed protein product [Cercopithifilaria johnstoni]